MIWPKPTSLIFLVLLSAFLGSCAPKDQTFTVSGTLESDDIDLTAPFVAELLDVRFPEGATVNAGDTLAVLDTTLVAAARDAAQAAVAEATSRLADLQAGSDVEKIRAAEARLAQAESSAKQSLADLRRSEKLHQEGLLDDRSLEQAQLQQTNSTQAVTVAEQELADLRRGARIEQIRAASSALQRAEAELAAQTKKYSDAFIIAPENGVVQILPYQVGERIPLSRPVVTLRNPENLWVKIYVPEGDINVVRIGDTLSFSVDSYPERSFTGQVVFISNEAEFTPRNVQSPEERVNLVFAVKVAVVVDQQDLRAGMPADFVL